MLACVPPILSPSPRVAQNPRLRVSNMWAILVGAGRMAQSNAELRRRWAQRWIEVAHIGRGEIRGKDGGGREGCFI